MAKKLKNSWIKKHFSMCETVALWSKDLTTKVGAVIIDRENNTLCTGYNGFPRGVGDLNKKRLKRPEKYIWTEHAERNAIYAAARNGIILKDKIMFTTLFPCVDCARGIIQSGITDLYCYTTDFEHKRYGEVWRKSMTMFEEGHIKIHFIKKEI